ncbi:MAG: hypothetical protein II707_09600 [Spirochaetales bacterium]|nr:hypothetical protein [Spirochaetales bacterium]
MINLNKKLNSFIETYFNNETAFASLFEEKSRKGFHFLPNIPTIPGISKGWDIKNWLPDNQEVLRNLDKEIKKATNEMTFQQYLFYLIDNKKLDPAKVYKEAMIDRRTFSKIKSEPTYHPSKLTALCFCIGLRLTMPESKDLLARAGYAFSPCDKTDLIFSFFITNKEYHIDRINQILYDYNLPTIGKE